SPEVADSRVVWMPTPGNYPERHVLMGLPLYLPRRRDPYAVPIQEQRHHHLRIVRREAPQLALVVRVDRGQVQLLDDIQDEQRQVVLRQPLQRRRRQQKCLPRCVRAERLAHAPQEIILARPCRSLLCSRLPHRSENGRELYRDTLLVLLPTLPVLGMCS